MTELRTDGRTYVRTYVPLRIIAFVYILAAAGAAAKKTPPDKGTQINVKITGTSPVSSPYKCLAHHVGRQHSFPDICVIVSE